MRSSLILTSSILLNSPPYTPRTISHLSSSFDLQLPHKSRFHHHFFIAPVPNGKGDDLISKIFNFFRCWVRTYLEEWKDYCTYMKLSVSRFCWATKRMLSHSQIFAVQKTGTDGVLFISLQPNLFKQKGPILTLQYGPSIKEQVSVNVHRKRNRSLLSASTKIRLSRGRKKRTRKSSERSSGDVFVKFAGGVSTI